jgi:hypothetical protein
MTGLSNSQLAAITMLADAIVEAVKAAGPLGAPGGHLYAALMGKVSAQQFETFMSALVGAGKLIKRGQLYFVADATVAS